MFRQKKSAQKNLPSKTQKVLVRPTGLEPGTHCWTRPSNVRVCQFRHGRKRKNNYTKQQRVCQEEK